VLSLVSEVRMVSKLRRLKASRHSFHTNFNALSDFQNFAAIPADSIHLKKPSVGPKGLIGPPLSMPWGPWPAEVKKWNLWKLLSGNGSGDCP
jgi:hypothetical protein